MFRFTIRELILLTVIVATGAAWWADRRNLARFYQKTEAVGFAREQQLYDKIRLLDQVLVEREFIHPVWNGKDWLLTHMARPPAAARDTREPHP